MSLAPDHAERLRFLARVVAKEVRLLIGTDARLFAEPFTVTRAQLLDAAPILAERVEAFASRFARLQDTIGDKLIPSLLMAVGETPATAIDNLDRIERRGWA